VKFWGSACGFAFVAQPQTNGVLERFNRTVKEHALYGPVFREMEEVCRAVGEFIE
jgi:putative transposase